MPILISVIIIVCLLALSALFAATETAITAASLGKIHKLKNLYPSRTSLSLKILKSKEKVISTMLIGNSAINTLCTTVATSMFIDIFGDHGGTLVSSVVMSILIIVFAEVIPKAIAVAKSEPIIIFSSPAISIFLRFLKPVNLVLDLIVKLVCFIFRIELKQSISVAEEVRGVIEYRHEEGTVYKTDKDMLSGVLDLNNMEVSEIMVHRRDVISFNVDLPDDEIIDAVLSNPYSRIPFWKNDKDNIVGVLHVRDLLKALRSAARDEKKADIRSLLSPPWFISENALVARQLSAFKDRKVHFACVVDEYGSLQGILTLEDILEEIVGQIDDEYDASTSKIIRKSDNEFIVNGSVTIRDINRELGWNLPDDDANTIAGLIIHLTERIPEQGESIDLLSLKIWIIEKKGNKIETVKIKVESTTEPEIEDS